MTEYGYDIDVSLPDVARDTPLRFTADYDGNEIGLRCKEFFWIGNRGCAIALRDSLTEYLEATKTTILKQPSNEDILEDAVANQETVYFRYATGDEPSKIRRIAPYEVKTFGADTRVVIGHDNDSDEIRSFRLDRIEGDVAVAP